MQHPDTLEQQAARCRRLARGLSDEAMIDKLLALAREYEDCSHEREAAAKRAAVRRAARERH